MPTGLETGRQLSISTSRRAATSTRLSSMHVRTKLFLICRADITLNAFVLDDVGELASGLGGFMGIFLGW